MKKIFFVILFTSALSFLNAQTFEAGGSAGISYYFGDLNTNISFKHPGPTAGLVGRIVFNDRLAFKLSANYARLGFYDSYSKNEFQRARNLSFESHIIDGAAQLEFHFLKYIHGHEDHFFTPYLFGGPALFYFNPRTKYDGEWVALNPLGTEGQSRNSEYSLVQPAINYGLGFKFDLNIDWSINVEISGRALFTDYLDDVSKHYVDRDELEYQRGELAAILSDRSFEVVEAPIGEPGRQRGDEKSRDKYVLTGISLIYNFSRVKCPGF